MLLMFPNGIEQCNHFFFQGDTCFHIPIQPSRVKILNLIFFFQTNINNTINSMRLLEEQHSLQLSHILFPLLLLLWNWFRDFHGCFRFYLQLRLRCLFKDF